MNLNLPELSFEADRKLSQVFRSGVSLMLSFQMHYLSKYIQST